MLVNQDFVKKLSQMGLNTYEAKIWVALLSRGVASAGELSDIANVPRSRSYDVLESLEKKGFILQKIGKPIQYVAIPPEEVIDRVKKQIELQAKEKTQHIDQLKKTDLLDELSQLHKNGVELIEPTDLTGSLRNRDNLYDQIRLLIKDSEEELLIVTTGNELQKIEFAMKQELTDAHKRGVDIKAITTKDYKQKNPFIKYHLTNEITGRFVISDQKEILFMLLPEDKVHPTYDVAVWANSPFFAKTIAEVFHMAFPELQNSNSI